MKFFRSLLKGTLLCLALCLLSGCAGNDTAAWREYKVYCGMSSRNGEVSEEAWRHFCDRYVSTAFPGGYTVLDAEGCWRSGSGTTEKERSKVILIVAPAGVREKVRAVAERYREQFGQESVLISSSGADTDFVQAEADTAK